MRVISTTVVVLGLILITGNSLFAQSISGEIPVCTAYGYHLRPQIASNGRDGAFIVWLEESVSMFDIKLQMINGDGTRSWVQDGIILCEERRVRVHFQQLFLMIIVVPLLRGSQAGYLRVRGVHNPGA